MTIILKKPDRDPLFGHSRQQIFDLFRQKLEKRAQSAYFFGSFATDSLAPYSDIDLIIVKKTNISFIERTFEFSDLLDIIPTIDILVYTPEEFAKLTLNPTNGFWKEVVKDMVQFL